MTPGRRVLDGIAVEVRTDRDGIGVRVSAQVVEPVGSGLVPASVLAAETLGAPGDTSFDVRDGTLVATRFLADPSDPALDEATWILAKRVVALHELGRVFAAGEAANDRSTTGQTAFAAELPPAIGELLARSRTVTTSQPVRSEPDPSTEPIGMLQPGRFYEVVESSGGWTRVVDEEGRGVWVGADALVSEEGG